jgi:membrane protease YdiL (CAAX protease family)
MSYFLVYLFYLCVYQEGELAHWGTLVGLPLVGVWWLGRRGGDALSLVETARRLGVHWPHMGRGWFLALVLGVLVQGFQLMNGPQRRELFEVVGSGEGLWLIPVALLLVLVTAAFTEEFFFRGVFQRAITSRLRSSILGILVTSAAFSCGREVASFPGFCFTGSSIGYRLFGLSRRLREGEA